MIKMKIYEPAMCCETGLCGVGINPELLRISTVLNNLEKLGVKVERYNLSSAPQEFIRSKIVNDFINTEGVEKLPIIVVEDKIVMYGKYPSNIEIGQLLNVDVKSFTSNKLKIEKGNKGCCEGGCC